VNQFLRILRDQVSADVRALPETARSRLGDEGRVARCANIADLRSLARRRVPRAAFDFVDGAAWDEVTARRNCEDFERLTIEPRVLVDVSDIDTATTVLGQPVALPVVGAPTGLTGLMHKHGEVAVARALHAAGTISTLSTAASYRIEEVAEASTGPMWFQVYVWRDRGLVRELIERARAAGHVGLVVTVDVARAGPRERDIRNGFSIPPRITLRSCLDAVVRPGWSLAFVRGARASMVNAARQPGGADAVSLVRFVNEQFDPSVTWPDLEWMRDVWQGPLAIKGILRPEDARAAVEIGATGIIVSNHGGRQLDHAPSAIRALPAVVDAVGDDAEVILDGGVRRGTDILKAVALGARACMVGRALMYGLGAGGEAGVRRAVQILSDELRLAMALAGVPSIGAVDETLVAAQAPAER
jgi:L-lactate dehydrogenase (cytochrome)